MPEDTWTSRLIILTLTDMTSGTWLSSVISADSSDDRRIGFKGCYIIDRTYMTAETWISSVISTDSL
jgi:hypothetical protein